MEENKTLEIVVPEGYEIDKENSTFEKIVFKKKQEKSWRSRENATSTDNVTGYVINILSNISYKVRYHDNNSRNIFATEKQAKSALAMAQISQIMKNDPRFGGPITDEEWEKGRPVKYVICRYSNNISMDPRSDTYDFIAFHTPEQRDLFLKENEDLVRDYLMLD